MFPPPARAPTADSASAAERLRSRLGTSLRRKPCCAAVLLALLMLLLALTSVASTELLGEARANFNWTVGVRRKLHATPELLYELDKTWRSCAPRSTSSRSRTSGRWRAGGSSRRSAAASRRASRCAPTWTRCRSRRAVRFQARRPGRCRACGHDAHTAMLLAAAKMLKAREASLNGTVKLVFQPAEEGGGRDDDGGRRRARGGAEDRTDVWAARLAGDRGGRGGWARRDTIMAAAGFFHATLRGHGGQRRCLRRSPTRSCA